MRIPRRQILRIGGGFLAGLLLPRLPLAAEAVEIRMQGNADGTDILIVLGTAVLLTAIFAPLTTRLYRTRS